MPKKRTASSAIHLLADEFKAVQQASLGINGINTFPYSISAAQYAISFTSVPN